MAESKSTKTPPKTKRIYSNDGQIDSDTFKLEVANFMKNLSFDAKNPIWQGVEHCHFFHTFDSAGRVMTTSSKVGGHHHTIEISENDKGELTGKCSPAIGNGEDEHTHIVRYVKSDRVQIRTISKEFSKHMANIK